MPTQIRPIIFASKCLGFAACRYNGVSLPDPVVDALKPFVDFKTACPEAEIGLGIPRDPIRIVTEGGLFKLYQPSTKRDLTDAIQKYAAELLSKLGEVDGFILKFRSPSCGLKGVKVYPVGEKVGQVGTTSGFFGAEVLKRFALYPIEDEGRLKNFGIREHFLTQLFAVTGFRYLKKDPSAGALVEFHSSHKLMLMAYNQSELSKLGKIVANHEKLPIGDVLSQYEAHFRKALSTQPKPERAINVFMHALGYFSKGLSASEKKFFLDQLERFRLKKIPMSVPIALVRGFIERFDEAYLRKQSFFSPYPEELLEVTDSGKGRNIE